MPPFKPRLDDEPDPTATPTLLPLWLAVAERAPPKVTIDVAVKIFCVVLIGVIIEIEAPRPFLATLPADRTSLRMEALWFAGFLATPTNVSGLKSIWIEPAPRMKSI